MTRMEMWQSYREELANQANISVVLADDEVKRIQYKAEIEKINPAILSSTKNETILLQSGVSNVEIDQNEIPSKIANMFSTINKAADVINQDKVETLLNDMKDEKFTDNDNKFKEQKLLQDPNYAWFKNEIKDLDLNKSGNEEIEKQLKNKYNDLTSKKDKHEVAPITTINKDLQKQASHYIFVVSVSLSILLLVILVALFITKMVLK